MLPAILGAVGAAAGTVARVGASAAMSVGRAVGKGATSFAKGAAKAASGAAKGARSVAKTIGSGIGRVARSAGASSEGAPRSGEAASRVNDSPIQGELMPADENTGVSSGDSGADGSREENTGVSSGDSGADGSRELVSVNQSGFERIEQGLSPLEQAVTFWERTASATERTADSVERLGDSSSDEAGDADRQALVDGQPTPPDAEKKAAPEGKASGGALSGIMKTIMGFIKKLKSIFLIVGIALAGVFMGDMSGIFTKMKDLFGKIVEMLGPLFEVIGEKILPPLFKVFESLLDVFMKIVEVAMPIITNLIETLLPPLFETFSLLVDIFGNIIEFLSPVLVMVGEIIGTVAGVILEVINGVLRFLTDPIGYLKDGLAYLANGGDRILVGIGGFINGIIEFIAGLADKIPFVGDSIAASLREAKVEFGNDAQARIDTRDKEMAERAVNRQVDEYAKMDPETRAAELDKAVENGDITSDQRASIESKILSDAGGQQSEQQGPDALSDDGGQQSEQQGPDATQVTSIPTEAPATKVNPQGDILSMLDGMQPTIGEDGSVIVRLTGRRGTRTKKLQVADFSPFPAEEVAKAIESRGLAVSDSGIKVADATQAVADVQGAGGGANVSAATDATNQSAADVSEASSSGGSVSQMNTVNAPSNVVNSTTTGIIYTDDSSLYKSGRRMLPGISRAG